MSFSLSSAIQPKKIVIPPERGPNEQKSDLTAHRRMPYNHIFLRLQAFSTYQSARSDNSYNIPFELGIDVVSSILPKQTEKQCVLQARIMPVIFHPTQWLQHKGRM
jgi:hypothetical protein